MSAALVSNGLINLLGLVTDYSGDEFGRTVAIIIGILAGLALLVVFISFLTKACKSSKLCQRKLQL